MTNQSQIAVTRDRYQGCWTWQVWIGHDMVADGCCMGSKTDATREAKSTLQDIRRKG